MPGTVHAELMQGASGGRVDGGIGTVVPLHATALGKDPGRAGLPPAAGAAARTGTGPDRGGAALFAGEARLSAGGRRRRHSLHRPQRCTVPACAARLCRRKPLPVCPRPGERSRSLAADAMGRLWITPMKRGARPGAARWSASSRCRCHGPRASPSHGRRCRGSTSRRHPAACRTSGCRKRRCRAACRPMAPRPARARPEARPDCRASLQRTALPSRPCRWYPTRFRGEAIPGGHGSWAMPLKPLTDQRRLTGPCRFLFVTTTSTRR